MGSLCPESDAIFSHFRIGEGCTRVSLLFYPKTNTHSHFPNHDLSISSTRSQEPPVMTPLQHPNLIRMFAQDMRRHARERSSLARVVREEGHGWLVVVVGTFELLVFPRLVE